MMIFFFCLGFLLYDTISWVQEHGEESSTSELQVTELWRVKEIASLIENQLIIERIPGRPLHFVAFPEKENTMTSTNKKMNGTMTILLNAKSSRITKYMIINENYLRRALYAVHINALIFSETSSEGGVLSYAFGVNASISAVNQMGRDNEREHTIPIEKEKMVFEVLRMNKNHK